MRTRKKGRKEGRVGRREGGKRKERKERKEERKAVEERGRPGKKELYSVIIKTAPALNKTHINL